MPQPPDQTFPKKRRVCHRADFVKIQRKGLKYQTEHFLVFARVNQTHARLGITTSRKAGKAVQRNLIKRLLREVFRQHKDLFTVGVDLVFVAKPDTTQVSYAAFLLQMQAVSRWVHNRAKPHRKP
jgi:ribonuclease P protein component